MQVLHPQSMRPAREGDIPVRVKNSYNPKAPGTLITKKREMDKVSRFLNIYSHIRACDSKD
jgi:aspartate kinase